MYTLPLDVVANWRSVNGFWMPGSVDFVCPHCSRQVNFSLGVASHRYDRDLSTVAYSTKCPGCCNIVRFWVIDPEKCNNSDSQKCAELCMHPTPQLHRSPMQGLENVPAKVAKAYAAAVNVYNVPDWNATAMLTGRALEGLAKDLLVEENKNQTLAKMLNDLCEERSLDKTLKTLVEGLRKGRNLGAHFDSEREVDQDMATMMIDFLEYFLEYLYILPGQIQKLHGKL